MRVLLLNYEYPPLGGGAANATRYLLQELAGRDGTFDLITSSTGAHRIEKPASNVSIHFVDIGKSDSDNIHYQSNKQLLTYSFKALRYAKKLARKTSYDLVHAFFGIPCGYQAMRLKLPYIVSLRGSDVPFYSERYRIPDKLLFQRLSRRIWNRANKVVANSEGLRDLAKNTTPALPIDVIPNGVDTDLFSPAVEKDTPFTILSVSRLIPRKGVTYLLEAFLKFRKEHPNARLLFAMHGNLEDQLQERVREAGAQEAVSFLGYLSQEEVVDALHRSDVFAIPSLNEGMSNSLLEGLAAGLAIIATNTGGTKELVDESNGCIVRKEHSEDIFDALTMLANSPDRLARMKAASRSKAESMSWTHMADSYFHLYKEIASKRASTLDVE